jgi:hypothetical protein
MKLTNIFILFTYILLISCGGNVGKILRNEKIKSTDEFLVKKKDPLILPPDFDKVPEPGSLSQPKIKDENKLKKILKNSQNNSIKKKGSSSTEESILKRITK